MLGRFILDNVMAAIEIVHSMKFKRCDREDNVALNLDIIKTYDQVDWDYLKEVTLKMRFSQQW